MVRIGPRRVTARVKLPASIKIYRHGNSDSEGAIKLRRSRRIREET